MESKSEQMAKNFKGGVYVIQKSYTDENGKRKFGKVDSDPIKGKKNAVRRADELQAIACKEIRAAGRSYKETTCYWVINVGTGTIVYQP